MRYNRLGQTGLVVSRMGFGAGSLGVGDTLPGLTKNIDQKTANEVVAQAIAAGITFYDTSDKYVGGQSEEVLGRALGARRKDVVVASKGGLPVGAAPTAKGLSMRHVVEACDASLRRLGTDWIDLYYAHTFDTETPLEETARAFEFLIQTGRVRYVAVSNWPAWMTARFQGIQQMAGYAPIAANQVYYSLLGREIERELVPLARATGLGLVVYSPLAGGFLTGKYARDVPAPAGTRRATFTMSPQFDMETGYAVVDVLKDIAKRYESTPGRVALAWVLHKPYISSVLFGISRIQQLTENVPAKDLALTAEDVAQLDALTAPPR